MHKTTIGEASTKLTDGSHNPPEGRQNGKPMLSARNIQRGQVDFSRPHRLISPTDFEKEHSRTSIKPGDILLTIVGAIGRSAEVPSGVPEFTVQRSVAVMRVPESIPRFLAYQLRSPFVASQLRERAKGTSQKGVYLDQLSKIEIWLPSLDTQRRIVQTLDELTARADGAEAHLSAIPPLVDKFKKSLLARAFSGELTREWRAEHPDVEPASELLERIRPERRKKWVHNYAANLADRAEKRADKKGESFDQEDWQAYYDKKIPQGEDRYEEPEGVDPEAEDLPEIPETWEWVRLGEIVETGPQNGLYEPKSAYGSGNPIIRIDDYQTGWLRARSQLRKLETTSTNQEKYRVNRNDILINRVNSPSHLGKTLCVPESHEGSLFESNMMRIELVEGVEPQYLPIYLNSTTGNSRLTENAKWAVNQASINQDDVTSTPVPLAPIAEQQRLLEVVSRKTVPSKNVLESVANLGSRLNQLRSSLLADLLG